jgi:hypothetical protein
VWFHLDSAHVKLVSVLEKSETGVCVVSVKVSDGSSVPEWWLCHGFTSELNSKHYKYRFSMRGFTSHSLSK